VCGGGCAVAVFRGVCVCVVAVFCDRCVVAGVCGGGCVVAVFRAGCLWCGGGGSWRMCGGGVSWRVCGGGTHTASTFLCSTFLSRASFFLAQAVSRGWRKWQYFMVVWRRSFVAGVCVCVWWCFVAGVRWRACGGGVSWRVCGSFVSCVVAVFRGGLVWWRVGGGCRCLVAVFRGVCVWWRVCGGGVLWSGGGVSWRV
jgi:hypothetical protein